jgi:tetratricopeptide (TPR) repeat protein
MMGSLRAFSCVLALAVAPAVAVAQPSPTPMSKQLASEKVKKAIAKSQAGDHEAAADLYLDAYAIVPQPLLLSNIGSEYQQMKKPVEALKYFCKYLEADPTGSNATYVTAQARTLYIELGGATTVEDGDLCKPIVKPKPAEPPPPPVVTTASVTPSPEPAPGPVDHGGDGSKTPVVRYVGIGVAVAGAAVFGAGAYFGLKAKSISDDITNHDPSKPWPSDIKQKEADGAAYEKKQIGFMIGGGVAVAAGVVMFVVGAPKKSSETSVSIAPVATGDTLGFAAAGRF